MFKVVHIIIATHGALAQQLVESAVMLIGRKVGNVSCLHLTEAGMEIFEAETKEVEKAVGDDSLLILADIFGATPCNVCLSVFSSHDFRLLGGVNLPMLTEVLLAAGEKTVDELWEIAKSAGRDSMIGVDVAALHQRPAQTEV